MIKENGGLLYLSVSYTSDLPVSREGNKNEGDKRSRKKAKKGGKLIVFFRVCICTNLYAI